MKLLARYPRHQAALAMELMVSVGILTAALLPIAYGFVNDQRLMRHAYFRATALELVDGEAELLAAGALKSFPEGVSTYPIEVAAATNLPPGRFVLHRMGSAGVLEWQPNRAVFGGPVRREFHLLPAGGAR